MTTINIQLATSEDITAIEEVGDQLFDHKIKPERTLEFLNDPRHHLFLAYDKKHIVGMASGFHYLHPDKDPILFVNEVGVLETHQNQGIARRLVRQLCEYGKKLGCTEAWVATEHSNTAARKAFVAAQGVEHPQPIVMISYTL